MPRLRAAEALRRPAALALALRDPGRAWPYIRGLRNTLRFNLAYFGLRDALRLPVLVSSRVWLERLDGEVVIREPLRRGMVRIGFNGNPIFDRARTRGVWQVAGRVVFEGAAYLDHGTTVVVMPGASATFGDDFACTGQSIVYARKAISFGRGCLVSWDVQILDSDWHGAAPDAAVVIGEGVWIGARVTILKGSRIAEGSIVAAGAVVVGAFDEPHALIAGVPARVVRSGVRWTV